MTGYKWSGEIINTPLYMHRVKDFIINFFFNFSTNCNTKCVEKSNNIVSTHSQKNPPAIGLEKRSIEFVNTVYYK